MERSNSNKIIAGAIVIAAVVLIAVAASIFGKDDQTSQSGTESNTSTSQSANTSQQQTTTQSSNVSYKDGTYTVNDTYPSPGGIEDIKVVLTLKSNTVTEVEVTQDANEAESAEYQGRFQESYRLKVVGKAINTLSLSRSSGASLTTNAFNDALEEIRQQAKA